jgi:GNAT superfamily N-acetyltransferase
MSTSGDPVLRDGRAVRLRAVPYEDPVARELVARVQEEYTVRYGGPDAAAVDPAEFLAPVGLFLVAEVDGVPAGCGAWRVHGPGVVEVKRVYVEPSFRRLGLAQLLMAELEQSAAAAGHRAVVLNSGDRQPEALALYTSGGYRTVRGYGIYAEAPGAVFLGKNLPSEPGGEEASWAS